MTKVNGNEHAPDFPGDVKNTAAFREALWKRLHDFEMETLTRLTRIETRQTFYRLGIGVLFGLVSFLFLHVFGVLR